MKIGVRVGGFVLCLLLVGLMVGCGGEQPNPYGDGFVRGVPEDAGVASHGITDFLEEVDNQGLEVHSFMFLRRNRVIAEGWWYPYQRNIEHIMNSVTKTFTSTAIGFAVQEKLLTVDDPVISFFPEDLPETISPNLEKLKIKHLLTMSAGQAPPPTFYITDDNWVKSFLATPITDEPGTVFAYSSYASYMLSAIISKVTGMNTMEYLQPRLFAPLDITGIKCETDTRGISSGGWGMRIKTADMAKLGQFYLQNGKWKNKQLLNASWIKETSAVHIYQVPEPTFEQEMYDEGAQGYGYQVWRCTHNAYRADGADGQFIVIMPDQEAVIITTCNTNQAHKVLALIWEHIFPSIMDRPLKENREARAMLVSKLASLALPDPFRTNEDVRIAKDETRSYRMEPNDKGIESISLAFNAKGECELRMRMQGSAYTFNFGQDLWLYGETEKSGPYYLNLRRNPNGMAPFKVAGYGSWLSEEDLSLRLLYLSDNKYETYRCTFSEGKLQLSLSNSMQPDEAPVILSGVQE
ncbi:CubicO group peptidase (beta-lactamase class C family) [Parabacteroides sp. PF5-5]|uniref:serine hydrolase domain-containing protein n=1 Tax=unclassified Parabacteroides TaxID=2649774 RepID=UPI0024772A94|nr:MULTISPECIES: serine hydrolase [unclassified Parabacteroides]MDH6304824.1 CubicO group peptidase (beta-lactamase class C family) [Parabacteroides sp. PH5-39]MDH6315562.1 CubicO group peptidase (beta-lactamase class C family) [Parabacteroides sp. PF5-13]MDH6319222.1 CubicO group peptidase (beta-lactamase class C family) [Parabacteroides sp. PH5-13]MDH6322953.1 CubicO group peptidase (beta-lactamase class C family) [Parabacteroides sp. PH5-8]MDH6326755.1 CubicO group peptidase (beta-lactamase